MFVMRANGCISRLCAAIATAPKDELAHTALATVAFLIARDELSGSDIVAGAVSGVTGLIACANAITDAALLPALSGCAELPQPPTPRALALQVLVRAAASPEGRAALGEHGVMATATQLVAREAARGVRADLWLCRQALAVIEHGSVNSPDNQRAAIAASALSAALDVVSVCLSRCSRTQMLLRMMLCWLRCEC